MDITATSLLKGVGQYFQGLPTASSVATSTSTTGGLGARVVRPLQHPQQQPLPPPPSHPHLQQNHHGHRNHQHLQHHPQAYREGNHRLSQHHNDGSLRSEQHSAVPVYWDQQNEGQAAAQLHLRQPLQRVSRVETTGPGVKVREGACQGSQTSSKTYYELQSSRLVPAQTQQRGYHQGGISGARIASASSHDLGYYYYGHSGQPALQPTCHHSPTAQAIKLPQLDPGSNVPVARRHLSVQPPSIYHPAPSPKSFATSSPVGRTFNGYYNSSYPPPASSSVPQTASTSTTAVPTTPKKKESPLDLSVKTVRTSADSTFDEVSRFSHPQQVQHVQYPKVDLTNFHMSRQQPSQQRTAGNYYNRPHATSTQPQLAPLPKVEFDFQQRKRSLEQSLMGRGGHHLPPAVPEKVLKMATPPVDAWRLRMDQQIEQRINAYAHTKGQAPGHATNGSYQLPVQQGSVLTHQVPTKPPATKKVLNLLRTSLQNKGVATPGGGKTSEVLHPSTDVMAPLQPKPGILGRRNVSPFTAASLERGLHTPPTCPAPPASTIYKCPKAMESVLVEKEDGMASMGGGDLNEFAAFLAARIRTKAELKQVGSVSTVSNSTVLAPTLTPLSSMPTLPRLHKEVKEVQKEMKEVKKELREMKEYSLKQAAEYKEVRDVREAPRKLFGANARTNKELRSSSETSVFDFPDSDNEVEMPVLERQRKLVPKDHLAKVQALEILNGIKDVEPRPASPFSLLFDQACDSFLEQLMSSGGGGKKRGRRKKDLDVSGTPELQTIKSIIKQEVFNSEGREVAVKQEPSNGPAESTMLSNPVTIKQEPVEFQANHKSTVSDESDSDTPLVHIASKQKKKLSKTRERPLSPRPSKLPQRTRKVSQPSSGVNTMSSAKLPVQQLHESDCEMEKISRTSTLLSQIPDQPDFYNQLTSITICKPGKKPAFGDGSDFRPGWEDALFRYKKSIRIPMQLIQVTRPPSSQRLSTSLPDLDPCPIPASPGHKIEGLDTLVVGLGLDSDLDLESSNCSFSFSKAYDSDQGSIKSMKSVGSKGSILDRLLVRVGARKKRRGPSVRKEEAGSGLKLIPKSESDLLPTPHLRGLKQEMGGFRSIVLKARTRTETRVLKEKATIREVFGEDRPASAPPVTCVDEVLSNLQDLKDFKGLKEMGKISKLGDKENHIKEEAKDDDAVTVISTISNMSNDSAENVKEVRRKSKLRRKLSSGFDYIRKKKKVKKEEHDDGNVGNGATKIKKRFATKASPETVDDIQKEVKQWVLNKGVGETHLHRASRAGYTDITAYCLEKMTCNPSPKDNAGYTPLHEACSRGHLDIARLLLQYGAPVGESAHGGIRPLHEAAENGNVEIIRLLLSYGADPALATYGGCTPLQLASDEATIAVLEEHMDELRGLKTKPWLFNGPAALFDDNEGYDPLADCPLSESSLKTRKLDASSDEDGSDDHFDFEVSEHLLPNLYIIPDSTSSDPGDRWVLLQDLSNALKIKSKETLLRQLSTSSTSPPRTLSPSYLAKDAPRQSRMELKNELVREMKMSEFLAQARCCQFMHANEKLSLRQTKIALVKYTQRVKSLLNVEDWHWPRKTHGDEKQAKTNCKR